MTSALPPTSGLRAGVLAPAARSGTGLLVLAVWLAGRLRPADHGPADGIAAGDQAAVEDVVDRPERWH